ncbi:MAG: radical SAM protein [bacterium]|nr:radical SAM protein [bacterium]
MLNFFKKNKITLPQYLNLLPSYYCNARCVICNIWQKNPQTLQRKSEELSIEFYNRLFADPWLREIKHITISGGEPFLYPQLVELVKLIPNHIVVAIATNATVPLSIVTPKLYEFVHRDKLYLQISLDGSESVHNQLRGLPNAYQTAMEYIALLKQLSIRFYFSTVINTKNYAELEQIYLLAKQFDTFVQFNPIHPGDYYHHPKLTELSNWSEPQIQCIEEQLNRIVPDLIQREKIYPDEIRFYRQLPNYLRSKNIDYPKCYAGSIAFYLDPYGSIYPCPVFWREMGNIKTDNPIKVWKSGQAEKVRREIARFTCGKCWHICQMPLNLWLREQSLSQSQNKPLSAITQRNQHTQ